MDCQLTVFIENRYATKDGSKATPPESDGDEKDGEITSRYPHFICFFVLCLLVFSFTCFVFLNLPCVVASRRQNVVCICLSVLLICLFRVRPEIKARHNSITQFNQSPLVHTITVAASFCVKGHRQVIMTSLQRQTRSAHTHTLGFSIRKVILATSCCCFSVATLLCCCCFRRRELER